MDEFSAPPAPSDPEEEKGGATKRVRRSGKAKKILVEAGGGDSGEEYVAWSDEAGEEDDDEEEEWGVKKAKGGKGKGKAGKAAKASSALTKGKGKAKAKGKAIARAKAKGIGKAKAGKGGSVGHEYLDEESKNTPFVKALLAALQEGDTGLVSAALRKLLPAKALVNATDFATLRRATTRLHTVWQRECKETAKETVESSEKELPVWIMNTAIMPETFANIMSHLGRRDAVRSSATSQGWWRTSSLLPQWQTFRASSSMKWSVMLKTLAVVRQANPWRKFTSLTVGHAMKVGSLKSLAKAAPDLEYLDLSSHKGFSYRTNYTEVAASLPSLKGLSTHLRTFDGSSADWDITCLTRALPKLQALRYVFHRFNDGGGMGRLGLTPACLGTISRNLGTTLCMLVLAGAVTGETSYERYKDGWDKALLENLGPSGMPKLRHLELYSFSFSEEAWMSFIASREGGGSGANGGGSSRSAGGGASSSSSSGGGGGNGSRSKLLFIKVVPDRTITPGAGGAGVAAPVPRGFVPTEEDLKRCAVKAVLSNSVPYSSWTGWSDERTEAWVGEARRAAGEVDL